MKGIIISIDRDRKIFYLIRKRKKTGYYLTNSIARIFLEHLEVGFLVEFACGPKRRDGILRVDWFIYIKHLKTGRVIYDFEKLKNDMKNVIREYDKLLFIDFEMSMPAGGRAFRPEIIQVGYVLTKGYDILEDNSYFIKPTSNSLSNRTINFLSLDIDNFWSTAKTYDYFYNEIRIIVDQHKPQIIIWGKNDFTVLSDSYDLHKKEHITTPAMFTDLLQLHKNYYSLKDDLGLFKAYEMYYGDLEKQEHDAKEDAIVTAKVYEAFVERITNYEKNNEKEE